MDVGAICRRRWQIERVLRRGEGFCLARHEARMARLGFMKKHFPIKFQFIEGTHLFPFEKPKETADIIKQIALAIF